MKLFFSGLLLVFSTGVYSQTLNTGSILKWIKEADPNFPADSVGVFYIDRELYYKEDTIKLNIRLAQITSSNLKSISFSRFSNCNYVPGKGSISILTISKMEQEDVKGWLELASARFTDNYISFSQHIYSNSQDPVLVIDNKTIHHTEAKTILSSLKIETIYDISVGVSPVPGIYFGQNARNGLVQIWTKDHINLK